MAGALNGVKILDLTRVLAGPYCTMILGDLGAEIIKVEAPGGSDDTRSWGPPYVGGESAYYLCANRNKRAITLNMQTEEGKDVLRKLIKESDVVMENFKNGTLEKWGFDDDYMESLNPKIIRCSITGFGKTGPYKDLPGYDYIIQAMGGLMSINGSEESGPMKVGVAISDIVTGLYAAIGVLAALNERNQSNQGQTIDISLFDSQIGTLINVASNYLVSNKVPKRLGNMHPNVAPYQPFATADGEMVIAVGNDGQFKKLCNVLETQELCKDERFSTNPKRVENRETLEEILSEKFQQRTTSEWLELLRANGIPAGPINNMEQLFQDEQVSARGMVQEISHPTAGNVRVVGSPLKLSRTPVDIRRHPPLAGEHTDEVLTEIGYTKEEIEEMRAKNIL